MKYILLFAVVLLVGVVERQSPSIPLEAAIHDADQRKELTPQQLAEIGYWRRHERHQAECRGQQYLYSCCDSSWDRHTLTCVSVELNHK